MSASPHELRLAEEDDFGGFYDCFAAIVEEGLAFQFTEVPSREGLQRFFRGVLERGDTLLVAVDAGRVVGWVEVLPQRGTTVHHNADLTIGLLATHRGRGMGSRLLEAGLAHARERTTTASAKTGACAAPSSSRGASRTTS